MPKIHAHAEYQIFSGADASRRVTVPFLLLGGGYSNPISPRTWAHAKLLFDVFNDHDSPYPEGEPIVNIGVSISSEPRGASALRPAA